jgi:very-short-patch-repair endonuclease
MSESTAGRSCLDCDKQLKTKKATRCKSCSLRYTAKSRPGRIERHCKTCGDELGGGRRLHATYCSKACKFSDPEFLTKLADSHKRRVTKTCPACKVDFEVPVSNEHRFNYCSLPCSRTRGEDVACRRCAAQFRRPVGSTRYHCSEMCRRPASMLRCEWCEQEFRVGPAEAKARRYCSAACYRASDAETSIERVVREALECAMVSHEPQRRIGRWTVDFLVGGNLVIEADGDYWHSLRPDVDQRKTNDLTDEGYTVWRISETEIRLPGFRESLLQRLTKYEQEFGRLPAPDLFQFVQRTRRSTSAA